MCCPAQVAVADNVVWHGVCIMTAWYPFVVICCHRCRVNSLRSSLSCLPVCIIAWVETVTDKWWKFIKFEAFIGHDERVQIFQHDMPSWWMQDKHFWYLQKTGTGMQLFFLYLFVCIFVNYSSSFWQLLLFYSEWFLFAARCRQWTACCSDEGSSSCQNVGKLISIGFY